MKFRLSTDDKNFGNLLLTTMSLTALRYLKAFLMKAVVMLMNVIFNIICQHLEELRNSVI